MSEEPTIFVYDERQSVANSVARDTLSLGGLCATAWFLNTQMPPSGWLNFALGTAWILWLVGRGVKVRMTKTPSETRAWLDEHYPASDK